MGYLIKKELPTRAGISLPADSYCYLEILFQRGGKVSVIPFFYASKQQALKGTGELRPTDDGLTGRRYFVITQEQLAGSNPTVIQYLHDEMKKAMVKDGSLAATDIKVDL